MAARLLFKQGLSWLGGAHAVLRAGCPQCCKLGGLNPLHAIYAYRPSQSRAPARHWSSASSCWSQRAAHLHQCWRCKRALRARRPPLKCAAMTAATDPQQDAKQSQRMWGAGHGARRRWSVAMTKSATMRRWSTAVARQTPSAQVATGRLQHTLYLICSACVLHSSAIGPSLCLAALQMMQLHILCLPSRLCPSQGPRCRLGAPRPPAARRPRWR